MRADRRLPSRPALPGPLQWRRFLRGWCSLHRLGAMRGDLFGTRQLRERSPLRDRRVRGDLQRPERMLQHDEMR